MAVIVRPHAWRIGPASNSGLAARITGSVYAGGHAEYRLASDIGELFAISLQAQCRHEVGAPVSLTLAAQGTAIVSAPDGEREHS